MQKWSYFSMGIMAGIIAVLLTVVIMQNREPEAMAAAQGGSASGGESLVTGTGGSQTQFADIFWVVYKRKAPAPKPGSDPRDILNKKEERISLCCYQVGQGGRNMRLVSARDISFDMDIFDYTNNQQTGPPVKDIVKTLRDEAKDDKPNK